MKRLLLASALLCSAAYAADPAPTIEQTLPTDKPVTAVIVAQCGVAVGVYATMPDGSLKAFDMSSHITWADQYTWAQSATSSVTVETKCNVLPEWLAPQTKVEG